MKKLLFIFMSVLTFGMIGCTNGSTKSSEVNDSTAVDSVVADSVKSDTDTVASDTDTVAYDTADILLLSMILLW